MGALFASGRIVDLIFLLMILEAGVLIVYRQRRRRGLEALDILIALIPGACLLFALRAALVGAPWTLIALWLGAALVTHLADLWQRQREL